MWPPRLVLGTWSWGKGEDRSEELFKTAWDLGIRAFDTAELYGLGESERRLGRALRAAPGDALVATKFMPTPWRVSRSSARKALIGSLKRLGLHSVELYQVHFPRGPRSIETWISALADLQEQGLTKRIGVSNFDSAQTSRAVAVLAERGIPLASNQIPLSILDQRFVTTVARCRALGVEVLAYRPLSKGYLATDKPELLELHAAMKSAGQGAPLSAVALAWVKAQGATPVFGASRPAQIKEACMSLELEPSDLKTLGQLGLQVKGLEHLRG